MESNPVHFAWSRDLHTDTLTAPTHGMLTAGTCTCSPTARPHLVLPPTPLCRSAAYCPQASQEILIPIPIRVLLCGRSLLVRDRCAAHHCPWRQDCVAGVAGAGGAACVVAAPPALERGRGAKVGDGLGPRRVAGPGGCGPAPAVVSRHAPPGDPCPGFLRAPARVGEGGRPASAADLMRRLTMISPGASEFGSILYSSSLIIVLDEAKLTGPMLRARRREHRGACIHARLRTLLLGCCSRYRVNAPAATPAAAQLCCRCSEPLLCGECAGHGELTRRTRGKRCQPLRATTV